MAARTVLCCLSLVLVLCAGTSWAQDAASERQRVLGVLLAGLPCSVRDRAALTHTVPCVNDTAMDQSSEDGIDDSSHESSDQGTGRRKRHASSFYWALWGNSQRLYCPRTDQTNVTRGLSGDPTDYPAEAIADFLILGRQAADPALDLAPSLRTLLTTAAITGLTPAVINTVGLEVRACPSEQVRLFSYNSSTFGMCWIIQNMEPAIFVNLRCTQRFCTNCRSSYNGFYNLCFPEFQTFTVMSFCPAEAFPLVIDSILVPTDCTCRTVRCRLYWLLG